MRLHATIVWELPLVYPANNVSQVTGPKTPRLQQEVLR